MEKLEKQIKFAQMANKQALYEYVLIRLDNRSGAELIALYKKTRSWLVAVAICRNPYIHVEDVYELCRHHLGVEEVGRAFFERNDSKEYIHKQNYEPVYGMMFCSEITPEQYASCLQGYWQQEQKPTWAAHRLFDDALTQVQEHSLGFAIEVCHNIGAHCSELQEYVLTKATVFPEYHELFPTYG